MVSWANRPSAPIHSSGSKCDLQILVVRHMIARWVVAAIFFSFPRVLFTKYMLHTVAMRVSQSVEK